MKGVIPGKKRKQKIEIPSANINIKNPQIDEPNINLKNSLYNYSTNNNNYINLESSKANIPSAHGESDKSKLINYNINGRIQGTKAKSSKKNIPKPNKTPNLINNYYANEVTPGYQYDSNFRYRSPKNIINYDDLYVSRPGIRSPKIKMSNVDMEVKGLRRINSKTKETLMKGVIPGKKRKQKIEIPSANINIKNPQIDEPNINLKGINPNGPKIEINSPNINNNNSINVNLRGPKIETNNNIPQGSLNSPSINLNGPSANINLNEIKIPDYNVKGTIHGTQMSKTN
jgi:hypothetical protein